MADSNQNFENKSVVDAMEMESSVRRVSLKLPVAVFTAKRGYDWSHLPDFVTQDEADKLYEEVSAIKATFPHDLSRGDAFEGVILKSRYAFAFRIQTVDRWDHANRDASYCAAAFVPLDYLSDVDFGKLFAMDYFTKPSRAPADILEYRCEEHTGHGQNNLQSMLQSWLDGKFDDFSWSHIGAMLSQRRTAGPGWIFVVRMICKSGRPSEIKIGRWNHETSCVDRLEPSDAVVQTSVATSCPVSRPKESPQMMSLPAGDDSMSLELEAANKKIHALESEKCELEREARNFRESFKLANKGKTEAERETERCRQLLKSQPKNPQIAWGHVVIAFLIGTVCGIAFLGFLLWVR